MKQLRQILLFPPGSQERFRIPHHIWLSLGLTGLGCCTGLLTLVLAATACLKVDGAEMFRSYFDVPLLPVLNLLLPVLLTWLFYFLSGRAWVGFLGSYIPCVLLAMVNYYKIRLRGDPLLGADLLLVSEAGGIVSGYTLDFTWIIRILPLCLLGGLLFALFLLPRGVKNWKPRLAGVLTCAALLLGSYFGLYADPAVYQTKTANNGQINIWSDTEVYVSKGVLYPFLHSVKDMFPTPPDGYDPAGAKALLAQYPDADIPADAQVDVVGIMLEAFCDLTDFPALSGQPGVEEVYAPWHALEEASVSGDLLTNIFAGGTVDSEWCFLTGYSSYDQFRSATDSYVWYLRNQGYDTVFHHPGHDWFYNRNNVNRYLGFAESLFSNNCFGQYVDPVTAAWHSDEVLVDQILRGLEEGENPVFSFSVSYQNHGPYETGPGAPERVTPARTGWSEESCNIINSYLSGLDETITHMQRLLQELEQREQPTVAVLFGDHKPWMGNGDSVYTEIGADFDMSTLTGFANYYSTPYLIWANSAAKQLLGQDFTGNGGDFSPCFLMTRLFDLCGWEGPGFMQLSRQMYGITPLLHVRGMYLWEDTLTLALPEEEQAFLQDYLGAQYYREKELRPQG